MEEVLKKDFKLLHSTVKKRNKNLEVATLIKGPLKKPLIVLTIFATIGMGLGFALGNYVYLGRKTP